MSPERSVEKKGIPGRWSQLSLRSKGVAVLTLPLLALLIAQLAIYKVEGDVSAVDQRVLHSYESRGELAQLRNSLGAMEAAMSAYSASGDGQFVSLFDQAREAAD